MELPAMDRGALALQVNEGKPKLVHLPDPPASESVLSRKVDLTILPDGHALLDSKIEVSGVNAGAWRQRYHAEATRRPRLQEDLGAEFAGMDLGDIATNNLEDVEQKVSLRVKGKAPQIARRDGETWSVPAGPQEHMVRTYAPLSQRRLDLRLSAQTVTEADWTLHLPAGAKVTSMPRATSESSPFGTAVVEVEPNGNSVRVRTTITMTKTRIAASEYGAFRAFCEAADRALGQRLTYSAK
jgi:hypothetical protein